MFAAFVYLLVGYYSYCVRNAWTQLGRIQNGHIYHIFVKLSAVWPNSQPITRAHLFVKSFSLCERTRLHNQAHRSLPCVPY